MRLDWKYSRVRLGARSRSRLRSSMAVVEIARTTGVFPPSRRRLLAPAFDETRQ